MHVFVGPFKYQVVLHHGLIEFEGGKALGLCDPVASRITISDVPPPRRRMGIFWHELGHAWAAEILQMPGELLTEEAMTRMIGVAAANLKAQDIACIQCYLEQGIKADQVLFIPGVLCPVPVIHYRPQKDNLHLLA